MAPVLLYGQMRCGVVFYWCIFPLMHKVSRTLYSQIRCRVVFYCTQ